MSSAFNIPAGFSARVADLLHLLQFATIECPTAGDSGQARRIMDELGAMLAAPPVDAVPGEPVANFVILREYGNEGRHDFFVNDTNVGYCDHDSLGWEGMASMRNMFNGIAEALGVEVDVQDEGGE